jgi:hypothetical protein
MTTYFFDVHDGFDIRDDTGQDLADTEAARKRAVQIAADFAKDPSNLTETGTIVVKVRNDSGATVATVRLVCQVE